MSREPAERRTLRSRRSLQQTVLLVMLAVAFLLRGERGESKPEPQTRAEHEVLNDRSAALNARGEYAEALEAADKALALQPNYSFAWNNRCVALIGLGRHSEALEAAARALSANPLNAVAWANKALVYRQTNQLEEALRAMDRAILIDANNPLIWYNKACCHALKNDRTGALQSLARAVELEPKLRSLAAKESDFDVLKEDPEFKKLLMK